MAKYVVPKRWLIVFAVFALIISAVTIFNWAIIASEGWDLMEFTPQVAIAGTLIGGLLWCAFACGLAKKYSIAGVFAIIAGICSLPIGIILIIGGIRIRRVSR